MKTLHTATACVFALMPALAQAAPIVYRGMNPHISPSAYPSYEASVTNTANLTKPRNTGRSSSTNRLTEAELIKQSTITGLSQRYTQLLTGSDSGNGRVSFGDGSYADYTTADGIRTITFYNLDGSTTEISFPL